MSHPSSAHRQREDGALPSAARQLALPAADLEGCPSLPSPLRQTHRLRPAPHRCSLWPKKPYNSLNPFLITLPLIL